MKISSDCKDVARFANRLRVLACDLCSLSEEESLSALVREIENSLDEGRLAAVDKEDFLNRLEACFTWGDRQEPPAVPVPTEICEPEPVPETALEWIAALREKIPDWSAQERAEVNLALQRMGLVPVPEKAPAQPVNATEVKLTLEDGETVADTARLEQLMPVFLDVLDKTEQISQGVWRNLGLEDRKLHRPATRGLKELFVRFLVHGGDVEACEAAAGEFCRRVAALLGTLGRGVPDFAREIADEFSPGEIEAMVQMEGRKSFLKNQDVVCWQRYRELAEEHLHRDGLEDRLRRSLKLYVEKLINVR